MRVSDEERGKIRESGTCDCVATQASSFAFNSFRDWEPVEIKKTKTHNTCR